MVQAITEAAGEVAGEAAGEMAGEVAAQTAAPPAERAAPAQPAWSIRGRMLAIALGVAMLAWLVGGIATFLAEQHADAQLRDARLVHLAKTLAAFTAHELAEIGAASPQGGPQDAVHVERGAIDGRYLFQIWSRGGALLLRSHDAPTDRPLVPSRRPGLSDGTVGADRVRAYLTPGDGGAIEIQVVERLETRSAMAATLGTGMFAGMLLSMVAVALLAGWLVVRALRPLAAIERLLRQRHAVDAAPLAAQDAPQEMQPMLAALNGLLQRIGERLSRERGFTALAAHELRTPLAALRLQVQVAQREADPQRRAQQLAALTATVDRCDHLLDQLLTLARLEQEDRHEPAAELDLRELADEVLDDLAPMVARRGVDVQLALDAEHLHGRPFAVAMLLRNLVLNALAHAPEGGTVRIASAAGGGRTVLDIDDSGPGIAPADRARVFERFVRLEGAGRRPGVGLGLSIVRSVADAHGAAVELLDSPQGGLRVRVSFPDALAPAGSPAPAP